jgi:hypothetical protein
VCPPGYRRGDLEGALQEAFLQLDVAVASDAGQAELSQLAKVIITSTTQILHMIMIS